MSVPEERLTRIKNLGHAKKLWDTANDMLEKLDVTGYLALIHKLHNFMKEKNLKENDLRADLSDRSISPKGFAVLQDLWSVTAQYSRSAATSNDTTSIESGFVSATSKLSAFFMDCKLAPNVRAKPAPDFHLDKSKILVSIMQFIIKIADPTQKIGFHTTKALMIHKIAAITKLEKSNNVNDDSLEQVLKDKGENLSQYLSYKYATMDAERFHVFTVTTDNFKDLKSKYQEAWGDVLKTKILCNFKDELYEATDKQNLDAIVERLKGSSEYKILKTGQGLATKIFGLTTSSVDAFEKMIKEVESDILLTQNVTRQRP